jgi:hypothetical protein
MIAMIHRSSENDAIQTMQYCVGLPHRREQISTTFLSTTSDHLLSSIRGSSKRLNHPHPQLWRLATCLAAGASLISTRNLLSSTCPVNYATSSTASSYPPYPPGRKFSSPKPPSPTQNPPSYRSTSRSEHKPPLCTTRTCSR